MVPVLCILTDSSDNSRSIVQTTHALITICCSTKMRKYKITDLALWLRGKKWLHIPLDQGNCHIIVNDLWFKIYTVRGAYLNPEVCGVQRVGKSISNSDYYIIKSGYFIQSVNWWLVDQVLTILGLL